MNHWLMKTEPETYSIEDLRKDKTTPWDGVRNYQARNFMRDEMQPGDLVLIYHSNTDTPGIVGEGRVASKPYPDPTQFDTRSSYYDPKATKDAPRWFLVDISYKETFRQVLPLEDIKGDPLLSRMQVAKKGNRLSITPVTKEEFSKIKDRVR